MGQQLKVLLCASEVVPFAKTGGLADVAGSLPKALAALGHDVRVALPKYADVYEKHLLLKDIAADISVPYAGSEHRVAIQQSDAIEGATTYFVVSDLFLRTGLYGHPDDAQRFTVFQRAVLGMFDRVGWTPDVIHCNDWQTALIPVYLNAADGSPAGPATLYTIHNLAYQGLFPRQTLAEVGLPDSLFTMDGIEFYGQVSMMKAGIVFADMVSAVSPTYAKEIQTPEFGERLQGVLAGRSKQLVGIVNGIDYDVWDPASDALLAAKYDAEHPQGKAANRKALQEHVGLPKREVPVFGLISRLTAQKGLDILEGALPAVLGRDLQIVILGTGDKYYHDLLTDLVAKYPKKMAVTLGFDDRLAHMIYSGSDLFLMPSRYEPCGLGQMIAMRYGSIPVVRKTGGLADTVIEFDPKSGRGNGFLFEGFDPKALIAAIGRGLDTYGSDSWAKLVANAMAADFSWNQSAKQYAEVYAKAMAFHAQRHRGAKAGAPAC